MVAFLFRNEIQCYITSVMSNSLRPHGLQAAKAPLSMGFSMQDYWTELTCPPPGDLLGHGLNMCLLWLLHCRQILYHWTTREAINFLGGAADKEYFSIYNTDHRWDKSLIPVSEDPLEGENGNPIQYSCLKNPMDWGPGGLQSMGLQKVGHDWTQTYKFS